MNPIDWLKAIYETFGTPYPRASLVVVAITSAVIGVAVWHFAAKQVAKDHQASAVPSRVTGSAMATGANSTAVTGDGNNITNDQSSSGKKPQK